MVRLHFVVEGKTEETFVKTMLIEHLGQFDISCDVRLVEFGRGRGRIYRGGLKTYERPKKDLTLWMKEDNNEDSFFTTMFDLYALPVQFPEYESAKKINDPYKQVEKLESAFANDLSHARFIPYIQLHEFEALVLSDPQKLEERFPNRSAGVNRLIDLADGVNSPELIDDGQHSAPSKRIISEIPEYEGAKASAGPLVAKMIGLEIIREKCPHFNAWLKKLEALQS